MLPFHFAGLCISASLILASPLSNTPTIASTLGSLPSALSQYVPACAQPCLQISLAEKYPVACSTQQSIECLCSRYSNSGEALGEVALSCVYSSCSSADQSGASAYNVCLGQKGAVMPTKSAVTIDAVASSRSTSTTSQKPVVTPVSASAMQNQLVSSRSVLADSVAVPASISPTFMASPVTTQAPSLTAVPSANQGPKMTPAQIAGLSVAAVAAFIIAVSLMALSVCLRRRKESTGRFDVEEKEGFHQQRKKSSRFSHYIPTDALRKSTKKSLSPPLPIKVNEKGGKILGHPKNVSKPLPTPQLGPPASINSSNSVTPLSQIGLAVSADANTKQILPPAMAKKLPKQQREVKRQSTTYRPYSTMTQETVFEEDELPGRRRSSALLPTPLIPIAPIRSLKPSRSDPTVAMAEFPFPPFNGARALARKSELFLDIPTQHERPAPQRVITTELPTVAELPAHPAPRFCAAPHTFGSSSSPSIIPSSRDQSDAGDIYDYYFANSLEGTPLGTPAAQLSNSGKTASKSVLPKKSASTVSRRRRSLTSTVTSIRDSVGSQTSFETSGSDDPTPEDEDSDKQLSSSDEATNLSPVAESPISNLRYPKVPRASNQLVPRSPHARHSPERTTPAANILARAAAPTALLSPVQATTTATTPSTKPSRTPASPPSVLQTRRASLGPLLLETRIPLQNARGLPSGPKPPPKDAKQHAPTAHMHAPAPLQDPFTSPSPPRRTNAATNGGDARGKAHIRSASIDSWVPTPRSKVARASGAWPSPSNLSPVHASVSPQWNSQTSSQNQKQLQNQSRSQEESHTVLGLDGRPLTLTPIAPLNVRRGAAREMTQVKTGSLRSCGTSSVLGKGEIVFPDALRSPGWGSPELTPKRMGEDLLISVGWGERV